MGRLAGLNGEQLAMLAAQQLIPAGVTYGAEKFLFGKDDKEAALKALGVGLGGFGGGFAAERLQSDPEVGIALSLLGQGAGYLGGWGIDGLTRQS